MPFELTEHVLERKGCPLHYWTGGKQEAPWVIFLHGACVDHHSFDVVLQSIGENYHVCAWDARGHGSSQPMGETFTVPLAVEDLITLMDELKIEKAVVVGHSNGTYVAQELAFRHPERLRAVVIIDGTCITWEHNFIERFLVKVSPGLMNLYSFETLKKASLPYSSDKKEVQDYMYAAFSRLTKKDFITIWTGVTQCLHAEPDFRFSMPMLLMHGDSDRTGDIMKIAPKWAAREPNCRYVVIPESGHFAPLDNPDFVIRTISDFLSSLNG